MEQDLIHHRLDGAAIHQAFQVAYLEVGDADGPQLAFFVGIFQSAPCGTVALYIAILALVHLGPGLRAVDDHHVKVVEAHLFQGLIDACLGLLVGLVLCGHLGDHEQFLPGDAAGADALAHTALVAVGLRSIEVAVAQLCGGADGLGHVCIIDEPGAQTQLRDFDAII